MNFLYELLNYLYLVLLFSIMGYPTIFSNVDYYYYFKRPSSADSANYYLILSYSDFVTFVHLMTTI